MINKPISKKVVPRRIRAEQVGTIINLIRDESSLIEFEDLVDVTMEFSNAASKEKIRAFGNLIKTCPKIERLTICFESRENHYREASDRVLPSNSPIWQSLENLNLKYLSVQSGILPSDLIRTLPFWSSLKEMDLGINCSSNTFNQDVIPIHNISLERLRLRRGFTVKFLSSLAEGNRLKYLQIENWPLYYPALTLVLLKLIPNLEALALYIPSILHLDLILNKISSKIEISSPQF